jgi:two-component system KDP operon response regulator KdpE
LGKGFYLWAKDLTETFSDDKGKAPKGREIKLTATEYALVRLFVRHPGRVLTHRHILREIWGPKSEEHRQYLRVYVTHLRQKIESDPASPSLIKTEPGIGYRFISNEAF